MHATAAFEEDLFFNIHSSVGRLPIDETINEQPQNLLEFVFIIGRLLSPSLLSAPLIYFDSNSPLTWRMSGTDMRRRARRKRSPIHVLRGKKDQVTQIYRYIADIILLFKRTPHENLRFPQRHV